MSAFTQRFYELKLGYTSDAVSYSDNWDLTGARDRLKRRTDSRGKIQIFPSPNTPSA